MPVQRRPGVPAARAGGRAGGGLRRGAHCVNASAGRSEGAVVRRRWRRPRGKHVAARPRASATTHDTTVPQLARAERTSARRGDADARREAAGGGCNEGGDGGGRAVVRAVARRRAATAVTTVATTASVDAQVERTRCRQQDR